MSAPAPRAAPRRRTRLVAIVIAVMTVLLVLDLTVAQLVQRRVQGAVAGVLPGAGVVVRVGGPPVVGHLLFDQLGSVHLEAQGVQLPGADQGLSVRELSATATGVHGVRSGHRFQLDEVDGAATVDWSELSRAVGAELTCRDGVVRITGTVPVLDTRVRGTIQGQLTLDPSTQEIGLAHPTGTLDGVDVPPAILTGLVARLSDRLTLPSVPGLTWTSVTSDEHGVTLGFRGRSLVFTT